MNTSSLVASWQRAELASAEVGTFTALPDRLQTEPPFHRMDTPVSGGSV